MVLELGLKAYCVGEMTSCREVRHHSVIYECIEDLGDDG